MKFIRIYMNSKLFKRFAFICRFGSPNFFERLLCSCYSLLKVLKIRMFSVHFERFSSSIKLLIFKWISYRDIPMCDPVKRFSCSNEFSEPASHFMATLSSLSHFWRLSSKDSLVRKRNWTWNIFLKESCRIRPFVNDSARNLFLPKDSSEMHQWSFATNAPVKRRCEE